MVLVNTPRKKCTWYILYMYPNIFYFNPSYYITILVLCRRFSNGHVETFIEYYKQKDFCVPIIHYLNTLISNSYNFTEIQFSYGNLTGIIIIKKKSCLSRWRVCLDRNYIFLRLFFTYSRVYSRLSRYTSILRVQNIGAILHDYMQYSGSRMYSV